MQTVTTPRRLYKAPGAEPPVLETRGLPVNAGKYLTSRYIEQTVNPRETVKVKTVKGLGKRGNFPPRNFFLLFQLTIS